MVPGGYIPVYTTLYTPRVHHPTLPRCTGDRCIAARLRLTEPWAQEGETPRVRAFVRVNVVKSVMCGRALCAELLRFSRE